MPTVTPISITQIDWNSFNRIVTEATGQSPTRNLDAAGIKLDKPASFILALDSFIGADRSVWLAMKDSGLLLKHLSIGFLIEMTQGGLIEIYDLLPGGIKSTYAKTELGHLVVATGTIYDWRQAILEGGINRSQEHRTIMNQIHSFLDQAGFVDLWRDYRRRSLVDGSFIMEKA